VQFDQLNRREYRDLGAVDRAAPAGYAVGGKGHLALMRETDAD